MAQSPGGFYSFHRHGFVRVAACTPRVHVGDPTANAEETLALFRRADAEGCDLALFPELGISGYAIDDLVQQEALLDAVEAAIGRLVEASRSLRPVLVAGAPIRRNGRLYNCAVVVRGGTILGVTPKSFLPNYREYYEKRWFAPGRDLVGLEVDLAGQRAPFGVDLLFEASDLADFVFHAEICEDFWAPTPPSTRAALAGATILLNLSASNVVVGKAAERATLCAAQSARCAAVYVFAASGPGESTTDLAWDGQASIHELGALLAEGERFPQAARLIAADVDVQRVRLERLRNGTFNDAADAAGRPETVFRRVRFRHEPHFKDAGLRRKIDRFPYVPDDPALLDLDCYEAFNIQVQGLIRRFEATGGDSVVIGVSGGLDSTHALLVACRAFDLMGRPREKILAFTLPGFATSARTKANAWKLIRALGVTGEEIDIRPAARRMLKDLGHPFAEGEPTYDVTFENVQAGLRTDYLFRIANQRNGFVIGTGDLSEIALGWSTYGVGDQMSHYNVNASVAKTLIQHLIRWVAKRGFVAKGAESVLNAILAQEISPELVPASDEGALQNTEERIGPYALQDFTLFHVTRFGFAPSKIAFLAWRAWRDPEAGEWPPDFPEQAKRAYNLPEIKRWMAVFLFRFFQLSQYKRSASPNAPKVMTGGSLSPRGDWRAPSDGTARVWLDELAANVPD